MRTKWLTAIAFLSLVIALFVTIIYSGSEPKPIVETFSNLSVNSDESYQPQNDWSHTGNIVQITNEKGRHENPVWAPDGMNIVYEQDGQIYIVDIHGGDPSWLATGYDPTFSFNGNEVFFVQPIEPVVGKYEYRVNGIEVLAVDINNRITRSVERLEDVIIYTEAETGARHDYLVWSPSKRLAALRILNPTSRLAVWDIHNGKLESIDSLDPFWPPSWSSDEQTLVISGILNSEFGEGKNPRPDIWTVDVDTCELIQITATSEFNEQSPVWSPDDSKIAIVSYDSSHDMGFGSALIRGGDICTINPDGSGRNVMANRSTPWSMTWDNRLAWNPGGTTVTYFSWGLMLGTDNSARLSNELWEIGQVEHKPNGGMSVEEWNPLIRTTFGDGWIGDFSWSPNGDKIAFEWTPSCVQVENDPLWGITVRIEDYNAPDQHIYLLEIPAE